MAVTLQLILRDAVLFSLALLEPQRSVHPWVFSWQEKVLHQTSRYTLPQTYHNLKMSNWISNE